MAMTAGAAPAQAATLPQQATPGDVAILKFLAAAELVEDDLWHQYCIEQGGASLLHLAAGEGHVARRPFPRPRILLSYVVMPVN